MAPKSKRNQEAESNSQSTSNQDETAPRERLPFEPVQTRKKTPKKPAATIAKASSESASLPEEKAGSAKPAPIPAVVSSRMARRMAFFCGIPTALGMATFVISYIVVTQDWFKLPNVAVVLVSMGFFGLGVLGLSYGVLSASWDEERVGTRLGWEEFTTNFGRLTASWKSARQKS